MQDQSLNAAFIPASGHGRTRVLAHDIGDILRGFKLDFYMVCDFPSLERPGLQENLVLTNWPDDLLKAKAERTTLFENKLVQGLRSSILPIRSDGLPFNKSGGKCEVAGYYVCDRFKDSVAISLFDSQRRQYLIILSASTAIDERQIGNLLLAAMGAIDRFSTVSAGRPSLSLRELECLSWSAGGKSSDEIAVILSLSAHTVNTYLKTAMQKLACVTRTQAVAAAVKLGLI